MDAKMKVERAAAGAAIDGVLKYVNHGDDRTKALLNLTDFVQKFTGNMFAEKTPSTFSAPLTPSECAGSASASSTKSKEAAKRTPASVNSRCSASATNLVFPLLLLTAIEHVIFKTAPIS